MNKKPYSLLIVDDDRRLRDLIKKYLMENGYQVETAQDALEARQRLHSQAYDLMVLDVMMPEETGIEFTQSLRQDATHPHATLPILFLTALGEAEDRVLGLEVGGDDYMIKPFEPKELLLRIQKILERTRLTQIKESIEVRFGDLRYVISTRSLYKNDQQIYLTSTESELLYLLVTNPGLPLSRDDLAERSGIVLSPRTIDVQITRLRKKIEDDPKQPKYIRTVRHKGYVFMR